MRPMGLLDRLRAVARGAEQESPCPPTQPTTRAEKASESPADSPGPSSPRPTPGESRVAADIPFLDLEFCVIDVETTGFSPANDRIVELAMLRIDAQGRVIEECHSLIDPRMPVDATFVHGIADADVRGAPTLRDLAPDMHRLLHEALPVAHNAHFDLGFLLAELDRAGAVLPELPYICTMGLRRDVGLPGPAAHRLSWACWQEGIGLERAHAAACDARATGALLTRYLAYAADGGLLRFRDLPRRGPDVDSWSHPVPRLDGGTPSRAATHSRAGVSAVPASLLLVRPAPDQAVHVYSLALAAAAEDFEIDADEVAELSDLVADLGMTADQVRGAHLSHLQALLDDRLADGLLTWVEQQEIRAFARLLGVGDREVVELLEHAEQIAVVDGSHEPLANSMAAGLSVCFTGEFVAIPLPRHEVWELASDAGMSVSKTVTKKLDLLVCLDPNSGTGMLAKARAYGTTVIDQHTFLGLAGVQPAPGEVMNVVLEQVAERRSSQSEVDAARRDASADEARRRNRERREARPTAGGSEQVLWCAPGGHEWRRPPQRGRPPRACPDHLETT